MDQAGPSTSTSRESGAGPKSTATSYTIGGVKVEFPTKAYPSQLAMMNKVIQGLKHKQNCLLESPTGSGKSLALLCAALAWQRHESARAAEHNAAIEARAALAYEDFRKQKQKRKTEENQRLEKAAQGKSEVAEADSTTGDDLNKDVIDLTDDDDDFKPTKRCKSSSSPQPHLDDEELFGDEEDECSPSEFNDGTMYRTQKEEDLKDDLEYFVPPEKKKRVPRIFFGTRTHKQISQITRELRKTSYIDARSVILSSREHTCINPMVEKLPNKNEACKELMDTMNQINGGCGFYSSAKKLGVFSALPYYGVRAGYDLEDLVAAGREAKSCPYYASRYLMTSADIVFCPYNYLIDPFIRKSMAVELEGEVIIFDEGHNMEDASREASSFTINQDEIKAALQDCERVASCGVEPLAHSNLASLFSILSIWVDKNQDQLKTVDYDNHGKCWTGTELMASMEIAGLDQQRLKELEDCYKVIMAQREKDIEIVKERGGRGGIERPSVTQATLFLFEVIFRMFGQLNLRAGIHRDDFRLALLKSTVRAKRMGQIHSKHVISFNFWCLNPAVAFEEIQSMVHCVILTSGTLSPIQSFQSELGTPFPIKLEASHVIDKNQVWAGLIGSGPNKVNLNGSYTNTGTLSYQDELGQLVHRICREMPHGVLCFFPSYRMLEIMETRWRSTGIWEDISKMKIIFTEPRTGASDFQEVMTMFYDSVANPMGKRTGALFLAVCRGKVSEGLDFADNNARAVICIGIPFPNYRDMQVEHKRDYNEKNRHRGLLSGGEWYEIQAFRALNQALGRCIRHRHDWGAIFLVDDRYCKSPRYVNSLSKWIRGSVQRFDDWNSCVASLTSFREQMLKRSFQEAVPFGNDIDQSVCVSDFMAPGMPFERSYTSNVREGPGVQIAMVQPNTHHPIQFDDDEEDEVKAGLESQDEQFSVTPVGKSQAPPKKKLVQTSLFRKQTNTNRKTFY